MLSSGRAERTHFKVCRPASGGSVTTTQLYRYVNEWVWLGPDTDVNKDLQREVLGRVLFDFTIYCPLV